MAKPPRDMSISPTSPREEPASPPPLTKSHAPTNVGSFVHPKARPAKQRSTPFSKLRPASSSASTTARVIYRSALVVDGDCTHFEVYLLDGYKNRIKGTFFNETARKFNAFLKKGRVYTFCGARVVASSPLFSQLPTGMELVFGTRSCARLVHDDGSIETIKSEFTPIDQITRRGTDGDTVNVIATISRVAVDGPARSVQLLDRGLRPVQLSLWPETESKHYYTDMLRSGAVVAVYGAKVVAGGATISLALDPGSSVSMNPCMKEAVDLEAWVRARQSCVLHPPLKRARSESPSCSAMETLLKTLGLSKEEFVSWASTTNSKNLSPEQISAALSH